MQFIYFDMGNVLLGFSHQRQAEQMARVSGASADQVWQLLYGTGGLHWEFERGAVDADQFYARFCEAVNARPDRAELERAANDIFWLNVPIVALVGHLHAAGHRLGVFSNTSSAHWDYCTSRFGILTTMFPVHALSFKLEAMKPTPAAYTAAAKLAGVAPEHLFFTDDRPENVAAAVAAGWDAVVFQSVSQLHDEFRRRGIALNY